MTAHDSALLIVDLKNDLCTAGALRIRGGERIIAAVHHAAGRFSAEGRPVLACRDRYPPQTRQDSPGAACPPESCLPDKATVLSKGSEADRDGYSAFDTVTAEGENLSGILKIMSIRHLYLCGMATDDCIMYTAMDALNRGFSVTVLTDAVAGINAHPGDCSRAMEIMVCGGVQLETTECL